MLIVSACLAGINCKYNGGNSLNEEVQKLVIQGKAVPVCPEQLGGCPTPRGVVEVSGGVGADVLDGKCKVIRKNGEDATSEFIKGAEEVLRIAFMVGAKKAILKENSPSCGCGRIYDGTFTGRLIDGNGVTAELLIRNGIDVVTAGSLKNI